MALDLDKIATIEILDAREALYALEARYLEAIIGAAKASGDPHPMIGCVSSKEEWHRLRGHIDDGVEAAFSESRVIRVVFILFGERP